LKRDVDKAEKGSYAEGAGRTAQVGKGRFLRPK